METRRIRGRIAAFLVPAGMLLAVIALGAALAVWVWLPRGGALAQRVAEYATERLGVPVRIEGAHWALWPTPTLVLTGLATGQPQPITVRRVAARTTLAALWRRELAIERLDVQGAALPGESLRAFRGRVQGPSALAAPVPGWRLAVVPLAHLHVEDLRWIDRRGAALAWEGALDFDAGWLPRQAVLMRRDAPQAVRLQLARDGQAARWRIAIGAGGGSGDGQVTLQAPADGPLMLEGELAWRGVDIEALLAAFGHPSPVAGRLEGTTTLRTQARQPAALPRGLRTHTRFTVQPAMLTRLDLARAVATVGVSRGGRTALDSLSGVLDTQAAGDATVLWFSQLQARTGLLTASGSLRLQDGSMDGALAVDVVNGVVGLPVKIGGTVASPELTLSRGALAGAAIGSAVLPGVGTAAGARLGERIEQWFDGQGGSTPPRQRR